MEGERADSFLVGQVASLAGVTVKAVRHYEKLGLIEPVLREANGYKRYAARSVVRVACIAALGRAGVPLARVEEILDDAGTAATSLEAVLDVLRAERDRVDEQIDALTALASAVSEREGQLGELGRPVVEDLQAALGDVGARVDSDAWRTERRVAGLLAAFGVVGDELPEAVREFIRGNPEQVAEAVAADAAFAGLRDVSPDDPLVKVVGRKMREARATVTALAALVQLPSDEVRRGLGAIVGPKLSAAQIAALRFAAEGTSG